jgi:starch synthase
VAPWSKTGGLGDVCGALPAALAKRGHAVLVVSPLYEPYDGLEEIGRCEFFLAHANQEVRYWRKVRDGVTYVFCQHPALQRGGGGLIYGSSPGNPYPDNAFRFGVLSLAAIEAPLCVKWSELFFFGGEEGEQKRDAFHFTSAPVFVANDWHGALTPVFLAARYQSVASTALAPRLAWAPEGAPESIARATAVTIVHNLFHLGIFPSDLYRTLNLPEDDHVEWFPALRWRWSDGGECMNFLKAGLSLSAAVALVSPAYAKETQTQKLGCGMDEVLRSVANFGSDVDLGVLNGKLSGALVGVVNGVDTNEWDPATDVHLPANYSVEVTRGESVVNPDTGRVVLDPRAGKAACKRALQIELGLREDPDAPLIGFIGRLDGQKGVDVLLESVPRLVELGAQIVLLGSGDPGLEDGLRGVEHRFKGSRRRLGRVLRTGQPQDHRGGGHTGDAVAVRAVWLESALRAAIRHRARRAQNGWFKRHRHERRRFPLRAVFDSHALTEAMERAIKTYRRRRQRKRGRNEKVGPHAHTSDAQRSELERRGGEVRESVYEGGGAGAVRHEPTRGFEIQPGARGGARRGGHRARVA